MRKRKAIVWGGVLLCTSLLLIAAAPANNAAKSAGEVARPIAPVGGTAHWTKALRAPAPVAIETKESENLIGESSEMLPPTRPTTASVKPVVAKKAPITGPTTRACEDCLTPNTDLGFIGEDVWGYSVSGDCSIEGKWYAEFDGEAGYTYHFDLCTIGTSVNDLDIKITDASCNILAGVDGAQACGWNPSDFTWDCPADGTYFVVLAPYSSYSSHTCDGDDTDTFTMYYFKAGACDVECPVGATPETELCGEDLNGGCDPNDPNAPEEVQVITNGETICGTGWFDGSTRDTDFYEIVMPSDGVLNITVEAEFGVLFGLIEQVVPGVPGCDNTTGYIAPYLISGACMPDTITTICMPAGTYYFFVGVDFDFGNVVCGTSDEYTLTVTYDACPTGACCMGDGTCVPDQNQVECEAAGGIYEGDATVCDPNPCPQCCDTTISTFPFTQDFEAGVPPFVDDINDDIDWTWLSGATGSSSTGPSGDHTTGSGYYVYTEATGFYPDYMAILNGPCFDVTGLTTPQMRFWYHMYGAAMGTLTLEVSTDNCVSWAPIWTMSGDQGDEWFPAAVDMSAYGPNFKVRFVGVTGSSYTSDMAIDDIWVGEGSVVTGACCQGATCTIETEDDCVNVYGGIYQGDFTGCDPNPCSGACCDAFTEECIGDMAEADCLADPNHPDTAWYQYETCATFICPPPYCDVCWSDLDDDWITNVTFAEINNDTGPEGAPCSYGDYTDQIAFLVPGGTYTLSVTFESGTYSECVTAWLDFNHNGQWEETERFDLGCGVTTTLTGDILVPMDAVEGPSLMRVTEKYSTAATDACTSSTYGETEDYGLMIGEVDGACCLGDGSCILALPSDCTTQGGTYGGPFTACSGCDCNFNTVDDFCDILAGTSQDCNANGIPDECDINCGFSQDCNTNGIPDECDIAAGTSLDCQPDGIPDECQLVPDCNGNGIPDDCEADCNANGVPDDCDVDPNDPDGDGYVALDCQGNGIPDECELGTKSRFTYIYDDGTAEDGLGITAGADICPIQRFVIAAGAEAIESVSIAWGGTINGTPVDVYIWSDPDGDGSPADGQVIGHATTVTANAGTDTFTVVPFSPAVNVGAEGTSFFIGYLMESAEYVVALDEDGTLADESWIIGDTGYAIDPNDLNNAAYNNPLTKLSAIGFPANHMLRAEGVAGGGDCNGNGIPDVCDVPPICDPNMGPCSVDCNGNLIPDECEDDCNGNGRPDDCDIAAGTSLDCNLNGIPDECDLDAGTSLDCNGNLIPDECDIDSGYSEDCNANGIPDECDIASGASEDCQGDTIPDECQLADRDIVVQEGFEEAFFPPTDWIAQIQNSAYTWYQAAGSSTNGGNVARAEYDPALTPQDEWIMTPELMMAGDVTLSGETMGSVYWGITPYDNYDVEAWVVVGPTAGDGDDILIGQLDEDNWLVNWQWETFSYVFTAPAGPFRVGFRYVGSDGAQADIDGIVVDGATGAPANDCNLNGIPDECDILPAFGGFCDEGVQVCDTDYNGNGVPDSCPCDFADFDGDGDVDTDDFETFRVAFGTCDGDPGYNVLADVDASGCVGVTDYQAWIQCYRDANPGLIKVPSLRPAERRGTAPVQIQPAPAQQVQPTPGAVKPYK